MHRRITSAIFAAALPVAALLGMWSGTLCGEDAHCCSAAATCPDGLVGASKECAQCCKNTCD